jgi:hypothetical protein
VTVTTRGYVVQNLDVTGCIYISANDVTVKNTRVHGGGCYEPIHVNDGYSNALIEDTEIDGQKSSTCGEAVGTHDYTLLRVNAHGCSDGPRLAGSGPITIRDSYIHDLSMLAGDHGDGIQAYGLDGGSITIVHNTITGGSNAAFFTADYATGDLILDNNLMSGGGYTLRVDDQKAWVRNNLIVSGSYAYGPVNVYSNPGGADPGATIMEWSNNRLCANADGTGVGALIPQP